MKFLNGHGRRSDKEVKANAFLIAAAPDLLDAAEKAFQALDVLMGDSDLPEDDSPEFEACQALANAIDRAKAR